MSLSSTASCMPVEAPEGTAARPTAPLSSSTSTSTVGLPRESRISRARTLAISVIVSLGSMARYQGGQGRYRHSAEEVDDHHAALRRLVPGVALARRLLELRLGKRQLDGRTLITAPLALAHLVDDECLQRLH